jgi:hypothetical protein
MSLSGPEAALYGTIWLALTLFVGGQAAVRRIPVADRGAHCSWWLWAAGAVLCVVHMILAMAVRHGWSHDAAVQATAIQADSVYGLRWGGGLVANYAFAAVWIGEAIWWRGDPASFFSRPTRMTVMVRAFYLLIIVNAAIVFASPAGRFAGILLVGVLIRAWWPAAISGTGGTMKSI